MVRSSHQSTVVVYSHLIISHFGFATLFLSLLPTSVKYGHEKLPSNQLLGTLSDSGHACLGTIVIRPHGCHSFHMIPFFFHSSVNFLFKSLRSVNTQKTHQIYENIPLYSQIFLVLSILSVVSSWCIKYSYNHKHMCIIILKVK